MYLYCNLYLYILYTIYTHLFIYICIYTIYTNLQYLFTQSLSTFLQRKFAIHLLKKTSLYPFGHPFTCAMNEDIPQFAL